MNHMQAPVVARHAPSRGISLIVVLMILIVVSLLGVGAAQMALSGERASRYDRDYQVAWQAADSAAQDAVDDINGHALAALSDGRTKRGDVFSADQASANASFLAGCGDTSDQQTLGLCLRTEPGLTPAWLAVDFSQTGNGRKYVELGDFTGRQFAYGSTGVQPARKPGYVIENIKVQDAGTTAGPEGGEYSRYRITAIGYGPRDNTQVAAQALYDKVEE